MSLHLLLYGRDTESIKSVQIKSAAYEIKFKKRGEGAGLGKNKLQSRLNQRFL